MKMAFVRTFITLFVTFVATQAVNAHPHMFFKSTAQFVLDEQGRLTKLRVVFLVDELNTLYTFSELKVNQDGDNKLTAAETDKVARTVMEGFGQHGYFTNLRDDSGKIRLRKPSGVAVHLEQLRLGLAFVIPLEKPLELKGKSLSLQLYDPTYFTAITIDLPPMVVGKGAKCSVAVSKPEETEQTRRSQVLLSQLSREETPDVENVGVMFAETTRLTCQE